jgi:hypothetical protein
VTETRYIATRVRPDITELGWASDRCPKVHPDHLGPAGILLATGPIRPGDKSSATRSEGDAGCPCDSGNPEVR